MNRTLLFVAVVALLFVSCKKEHSASTSPSGKKYAVALNVSNFSVYRASFSLSPHALSIKHRTTTLAVGDTLGVSNYLDLLYYYVFDSGGHMVHRVMQDSTMCDRFGLITDSLQSGTYTIVIAAGKAGLQGTPNGSGVTIAQSNITYGGIDWQDTFFKEFTISVGGSDINQTVLLNRIVTKLELNLLDAIPSNANTIVLGVYPEFPQYQFNNPNPAGTSDTLFTTIDIPAGAKGKTGFTYDKILGNQLALFSISVVCKDISGHVIGSAHASNVQCDANEKTILSGDLFSSPATGQSFTVKVDTAWGGSSTISF